MTIIHVLFDSVSDGWQNRETFAAWLHLTADDGLVRTASTSLHLTEAVEGALTPETAGRILAELLERHLDQLDDAGLIDEYRLIREDVGSLWRVDWTEIGAAFLGDERRAA